MAWPRFKPNKKNRADFHLEGGYEQIVFNIERSDARNDAVLYYKLINGSPPRLGKAMTQDEINTATLKMKPPQKNFFMDQHVSLNHPNITGPFKTGWEYTEFDGAGMAGKIGLPALPGQTLNAE